jgi:hypothetical protein
MQKFVGRFEYTAELPDINMPPSSTGVEAAMYTVADLLSAGTASVAAEESLAGLDLSTAEGTVVKEAAEELEATFQNRYECDETDLTAVDVANAAVEAATNKFEAALHVATQAAMSAEEPSRAAPALTKSC